MSDYGLLAEFGLQRANVVECFDLLEQGLSCRDIARGQDSLTERPDLAPTVFLLDNINTGARLFLQVPQLKQEAGLLSFEPKVRHQRISDVGGFLVRHQPAVEQVAIASRRLLNVAVPAKDVMQQISYDGANLLEADAFMKCGEARVSPRTRTP